MNKNIETFIGCDNEYEESKIVIFGAPFDSTTSYRPGARFGSSAIRHESFGLETYSPYQDKDMEDYHFFDAGDLELPFGAPEHALDMICDMTDRILDDKKLPFMIGGEHLVTLGAIRSMKKHFDKKLNYCLLNETGKKIFIAALEERFSQTYENKKLKRKVSLLTAIKYDAYKLIKEILEDVDFVPFSLKSKQ